jgi:exosortase H (IPTLxxWG-CTERM-specific)
MNATYFAAKFVVSCLALYALATRLPEAVFEPLNRHTAAMAARLLDLFDMHPLLQGITLRQDEFAVRVVSECSVLYMGILFFSFVVSAPAGLRRKTAGLALGIPVLHAVNIVRIALVFALGVADRRLFDLVHVYFGQVLMVLCVVAACLVWLRAPESGASPGGTGAFLVRFVACSAIPFLLWLPLNREYVRLTDYAVRWLFSLWNCRLEGSLHHAVYYQTFNLVTFTGIVLAGRHFMKRRQLRVVASGLAVIVGLHIAFRICDVLMAAFQSETAAWMSNGISLAGQYLVPVLFLLLLLRGESGRRKESFA